MEEETGRMEKESNLGVSQALHCGHLRQEFLVVGDVLCTVKGLAVSETH